MTWIDRLSKTTLLRVLIPLFVTVVGGLMIEHLKPEKAYTPVDAHDARKPKLSQDVFTAADIQQLLAKKWSVPFYNKPSLYGDLNVEFTDRGQVIRTYFRSLIPDEVTSHPYEVSDNGQLKSDMDLRLLKISNDELILSWEGSITRYKREMYWWEVTLTILGTVLGLMILKILVSRSM